MIWVKLMLLLKNSLAILVRMSQLNPQQVWKLMKSLVQDQLFSLGKVLDLKVSGVISKVFYFPNYGCNLLKNILKKVFDKEHIFVKIF